MRVSTGRAVLAVAAALAALVGCDGAAKDATPGAAAVTSEAAEIASGLPSGATTGMLKAVLPPVMQQNITEEELQSALRDGILVRTMSGGACQPSSSDPNANTAWVSVVGYKPGAELSVTVQSESDPDAPPALSDMRMKIDQQTFGVLSFDCSVPKGAYVVTVSGEKLDGEGAVKRPLEVG